MSMNIINNNFENFLNDFHGCNHRIRVTNKFTIHDESYPALILLN